MACLKCGRKVDEGQVFCSDCLQIMAACPVKQDAVVQLPMRKVVTEERALVRREATAAQTIAQLRKLIRWLVAVAAVLTLLLCGMSLMLLNLMQQKAVPADIGRNYTVTVDDK